MKKQVNVRLNPAYIALLDQLQEAYKAQGFNASQADIVEMAIATLAKEEQKHGETRTFGTARFAPVTN